MNTHDKIELPPLPKEYGIVPEYDGDDMQAYACSAIEADRKRSHIPPEINLLVRAIRVLENVERDKQSMVCVGGLLKDIRSYLSASPQPAEPTRGEPVAWEHRFRALPDGPWAAWGPGKAPNLRTDKYEVQERALYAAPQPAEPNGNREQRIILHEYETASKCLDRLGVPKDDGVDDLTLWGRIVEAFYANGITIKTPRTGPYSFERNNPKPAEPVKVPSDRQIRELFLAHGFRIPEGEADLRPYVYSAARALLARYGQPAQPGEDIMVNGPDDVYTLPLQPSGLTDGPRFAVHVPAQPAPEPPRSD